MNNDTLNIYTRKIDKNIKKKAGVNPLNVDDNEDLYEEIAFKTIEEQKKINLSNFKFGIISNKQSRVWLDNGNILATGGYWNGNICLQNINDKIILYATSEYSPIVKIVIDKSETFALCGNSYGTLYVFLINSYDKMKWTLYKDFNYHNSPITTIAIHQDLNIAISCSQNGLCNLYTIPEFKLYNSFILGKDIKMENESEKNENLNPQFVLISDKGLPCFIFYVEAKRALYFYSISGKFLKKIELEFSLQENFVKIYTDFQFVDYLVIFNSKEKTFDLYNMIDFDLIGRSPSLNDYEFIDYAIADELDHIIILCKSKDKCKLLILKDEEGNIKWK